eukprot:g46726.t1
MADDGEVFVKLQPLPVGAFKKALAAAQKEKPTTLFLIRNAVGLFWCRHSVGPQEGEEQYVKFGDGVNYNQEAEWTPLEIKSDEIARALLEIAFRVRFLGCDTIKHPYSDHDPHLLLAFAKNRENAKLGSFHQSLKELATKGSCLLSFPSYLEPSLAYYSPDTGDTPAGVYLRFGAREQRALSQRGIKVALRDELTEEEVGDVVLETIYKALTNGHGHRPRISIPASLSKNAPPSKKPVRQLLLQQLESAAEGKELKYQLPRALRRHTAPEQVNLGGTKKLAAALEDSVFHELEAKMQAEFKKALDAQASHFQKKLEEIRSA